MRGSRARSSKTIASLKNEIHIYTLLDLSAKYHLAALKIYYNGQITINMQAFQVFARVRPLNEREASYGYNKKAVQQ